MLAERAIRPPKSQCYVVRRKRDIIADFAQKGVKSEGKLLGEIEKITLCQHSEQDKKP